MEKLFSQSAPFLLITLLCVAGVEGFYWSVDRYLFSRPKPAAPAAAVTKPAPTTLATDPEQAAANNYSIILQRNIFGPPPQPPEEQEEQEASHIEELEATTLDIVLMGTIQGGQQNGRAVILNKKDGKQAIYKQDDMVQDAVIKKILRGKVILSRQGEDSILDISEAANYRAKTASRPVSVNPSTRQQTVVPAPAIPRAQVPGQQSSEPRAAQPTRVVRPSRKITTSKQESEKTQ